MSAPDNPLSTISDLTIGPFNPQLATSSSPSPFNKLPMELLLCIAELLPQDLASCLDLYSFSLINKKCSVASERLRLRQISWTIQDPSDIQQSLQVLSDLFSLSPERFTYVHRFKISKLHPMFYAEATPIPSSPNNTLSSCLDTEKTENEAENQSVISYPSPQLEVRTKWRTIGNDYESDDDDDDTYHERKAPETPEEDDEDESYLEALDQDDVDNGSSQRTVSSLKRKFLASRRELNSANFDRKGNASYIGQEEQLKEAWFLIVQFLKKLNCLRDLVYDCVDPLSSVLLGFLQEEGRKCRLHHHTFALPSLVMNRDEPHGIDLQDSSLATASSLHSLVARCNAHDHPFDFTEQAIFLMVAGAAPNLKHVSVYRRCEPSHSSGHTAQYVENPGWGGLPTRPSPTMTNVDTQPRGSLLSLSLEGETVTTELHIKLWSLHTTFSTLHSLHLHSFHLSGLKCLISLAELDEVSPLRDFTLQFRPAEYLDFAGRSSVYSVSKLLSLLPNLTKLYLSGPLHNSIFYAFAKYLRKLEDLTFHEYRAGFAVSNSGGGYEPAGGAELQYLKLLPRLHTLQLSTERNGHFDSEISCYRALREIPALQDLSIRFEVATGCFPHIGRARDELMQMFLKHSAVDRDAVRVIMAFFCGGPRKTGLRIRLHFSKSWFENIAWGRYSFGPDFRSMLSWVARSWRCRYFPGVRGTNDDGQPDGTFQIIEEHREQRLARKKNEHWPPRILPDDKQGRKAKAMWNAVWPPEDENAQGKGKGWRYQWRKEPQPIHPLYLVVEDHDNDYCNRLEKRLAEMDVLSVPEGMYR